MPDGSMEIPPGFSIALTIQAGSNNSTTTFSEGDVPYLTQIVPVGGSLVSVVVTSEFTLLQLQPIPSIKCARKRADLTNASYLISTVKPGVIVYDQANYLGANSFYPLGYTYQNTSASEPTTAGSVLFPTDGDMRLLLPGITIYESVAVLPFAGTVLENVTVETGKFFAS